MWMTEDLTCDWIDIVWDNRPDAALKLDYASARRFPLQHNIKSTGQILGEDRGGCHHGRRDFNVPAVAVNKSFKGNVRENYEGWTQNED